MRGRFLFVIIEGRNDEREEINGKKSQEPLF